MNKSSLFTGFFRYLNSVLATVLVLYLSFASPNEFKKLPSFQIPHADKIVHSAMYFLLAAALCYDFLRTHRNVRFSKIVFLSVCVIYPVVLGGIIEFAQEAWFYPRSAEWLDWLADIIGVGVAVFAFLFLRKKGIVV
jgi:VanZ family protein